MKKNKKLILIPVIIFIIMIIGLATGYYILNNKDKQKETDIRTALEHELKLSDKTVEYGTIINLFNEEIETRIKDIDSKYNIYVDDDEVTTYKFDKVGQVKLTEVNSAYYKNFLKQTKKVEVKRVSTYTVEDTKKPVIEGISNREITIGDSIDLKKGIIARDEIDGDLEIIIEGEVDTTKVGEYNVKVLARDNNGNVTEDSYTVRVKNKTEVNKKINNNSNTETSTKSSANSNSQSSTGRQQEEKSTYNYETYGNKIYFEEDRGTNGNYSEKFSW